MQTTAISILTREQITEIPQYKLDCGNKSYWIQPDTYNDNNKIPYISSYGNNEGLTDYSTNKHYVRPIIFVTDAMIGYRFYMGGVGFTVVTNDFALCESTLKAMEFGDDSTFTYETSHVKVYLEDWYDEHKS